MTTTKKHIDHLVQCMFEGTEDWDDYFDWEFHPLFEGLSPNFLGQEMVDLLRTAAERYISLGWSMAVPDFTKQEYRYEPPKRKLETLEFLRALHGFRMEAEDSPLWGSDKNVAWDIVEDYIQWITQGLLDYYTGGEYTRLPLFYNLEE